MIFTPLVLPWRRSKAAKQPDRHLVFASRFDSRSARSSWTLFRGSARIYLAATAAPGCRGASLVARPVKRAYYTASVWDDEAALQAFAHTGAHRNAVRALHDAGEVDGVLMSWWTRQPGRPRWTEVIRRTHATEPGPYRGPEPE
jgi:heme-degrading monooxygenase HmoA